MRVKMEPCQDFTFRFWVHKLQWQLHRDITAETRSHAVKKTRSNQNLETDWTLCLNPTHLAVSPPKRLSKKMENIFFIEVREAFSGNKTSLQTHPPPATIRLILIL